MLKKIIIQIFVKDGKADFIQEGLLHGGFTVGRKTGLNSEYKDSQRAESGPVDRKLLRQNIKVRGDSSKMNSTEGRPG